MVGEAELPGGRGLPLDADQEERDALGRIVLAFREYHRAAEFDIRRWEYNFARLPDRHKAMLPGQPAKHAAARRCAHVNAFFLKTMLSAFDGEEGGMPPHLAGANAAGDAVAAQGYSVSHAELDKIKYVLKNLARDWSADGAAERAACYNPILNELSRLYGSRAGGPRPPMVLVPGSGLTRLCCEIARLGLHAQGNEFSYHMLLTSAFLINEAASPDQFTIFPWMHSACNQRTDTEQLRGVGVPDVPPCDLVPGPNFFSMCAGDFVEVYSRDDSDGAFDCVVTCFFIDTAHNVIEYLEIISHVLRPGGHWINLGPLLYHWADSTGDEMSVELSLEEIRSVAQQLGLVLLREDVVDAPYIANQCGMFKTVYQACFWTMVKQGGDASDRRAESAAGGESHQQSGPSPLPPVQPSR